MNFSSQLSFFYNLPLQALYNLLSSLKQIASLGRMAGGEKQGERRVVGCGGLRKSQARWRFRGTSLTRPLAPRRRLSLQMCLEVVNHLEISISADDPTNALASEFLFPGDPVLCPVSAIHL